MEIQLFSYIDHVTNPGVPSGILQTVTKTSKNKHNRDNRIGRVHTYGHICDSFATWSNGGYSNLAKLHMNPVVQQCSGCISKEGGKEDQRNHGVVDTVEIF